MATRAMTEDGVRAARAQIRYLGEGSSVNRRFVSAGAERSTGTYVDHDVTIRDGREIRDSFSLDVHGFMLADHVSAVSDFHDKDMVERLYPPEAAELVKRLSGADHALAQGWMIRTSADLSKKVKKVEGYDHNGGIQPPAGEAHVDYSPQTAPLTAERIYRKAYPDGPGYSRFIAFSLWRAFSPPPQDCPLAVCDGRTLKAEEGVRNPLHIVDEMPSEEAMLAEIPGEDKMIAASVFRYRPEHRWWYFSNMTADEAMLFKFFDSDHDVTWRCPHSAFYDTSLPDPHIRESIEVRVVAFFD